MDDLLGATEWPDNYTVTWYTPMEKSILPTVSTVHDNAWIQPGPCFWDLCPIVDMTL
jgi:hypothetical protein